MFKRKVLVVETNLSKAVNLRESALEGFQTVLDKLEASNDLLGKEKEAAVNKINRARLEIESLTSYVDGLDESILENSETLVNFGKLIGK